ncbi:MAG: hypothetical protein A2Z04_03300 [Chloroflexi bacterium RBG_16_57_9]|nr:MAG: hypothetical protein A2Z04_03300 [Chloroflexi bacterium RBG_16_57_9]
MQTLTIELPEPLAEEIYDRNISNEQVYSFIVQAVELWLRSGLATPQESENNGVPSRFGKSAVPFVEQLINENRELFERLARL